MVTFVNENEYEDGNLIYIWSCSGESIHTYNLVLLSPIVYCQMHYDQSIGSIKNLVVPGLFPMLDN